MTGQYGDMTTLEDRVNEFISRRFPDDNNWTDGNCFFFAQILATAFDGEIFYDAIPGHFIARIDEEYFDWNGKYKPQNVLWQWDYVLQIDPAWAQRVIRDCIK